MMAMKKIQVKNIDYSIKRLWNARRINKTYIRGVTGKNLYYLLHTFYLLHTTYLHSTYIHYKKLGIHPPPIPLFFNVFIIII